MREVGGGELTGRTIEVRRERAHNVNGVELGESNPQP